ncbi:MAG: glucoamylase family protein [Bryobacteraceae bacterium]
MGANQIIQPTRRDLVRAMLGGTSASLIAAEQTRSTKAKRTVVRPTLPEEDDQFLEMLEKANFLYFLEQADPDTGLVKDRCNVRAADNSIVGSTAATGFGLTALCIGHQRGYIKLETAHDRILQTLQFLWEKMPNHRGFFFHFANIKTGERVWDSEVSSIDTSMLLCGILTCAQQFPNSEIHRLADQLFARVEWTWLSEDTSLLPHGWSPEGGFLTYRWDYYSELMMMYLLGMGSSSHPLSPEVWNAWKRLTFEYDGLRYIGSYSPLFVHQYSQAWFDFRGRKDKYADYFKNSIIATEAHRRFCMELHSEFPDYADDLWGITASDSKNGYVVWGGPPAMGPIDGTVVPSAPAGSLVFLPWTTLRVLKSMKNRFGARVWSRYGFVNAFNPLTNWFDTDVIGIDTGITMLMAENLRTGFVWDTFMKSPEAKRGLELAGFEVYPVSYDALQLI